MTRWLAQTRPGLWCALAFVALGFGLIPFAGVQTDEALFGGAYYQQTAIADSFRYHGRDIPTMVMSYVGALKTWLYALVFSWWKPSIWSIRVPMLLVGGASLLIFARFMQAVHGRAAAWIATALLATDACLIVTTTFDWGPVALQHFLQVAAAYLLWRFVHQDKPWQLALAAFLLGLALWNKAIFGWTLIGAGGASLLLFAPEIWRRATWRNLALAAVFFAGGASLLIRYNVRHQGATWNTNAKLSLANIQNKYVHVVSLLDGSGAYGYVMAEDNYGAVRFTFGPWLFAAAAAAAVLSRRRALVFPALAALLTWLMMACTADAGGALHHAVLLYPFFHWTLAGAISLLPTGPRGQALLALAAALLVVDNIRVTGLYRDNGQRLGGGSGPMWSDAIIPFVERIQARNPEEIRMYDWGLQDNLITLSARAWKISYPARPFTEAAFTQVPGALWVGHVEELIPNINKELFAAAEKHGYERVVVERVADRRGRPMHEAFYFRKR